MQVYEVESIDDSLGNKTNTFDKSVYRFIEEQESKTICERISQRMHSLCIELQLSFKDKMNCV